MIIYFQFHQSIFIYLFFKFYFIFKFYIIVLVLPNIKMNPPQVYIKVFLEICFLSCI